MSKRPSPQREWEQSLIDAYYDYRWRQVLQPLHDDCQRWAVGELEHTDLDRAIHETHKKTQELYRLFSERRQWLVRIIHFDEDWFRDWVKDHPAPGQTGP
jgi:hypothetical protein